MTVEELIELFRKQVQDVAEPQLWDDDEVLQYVVDAQDTFVRLIGGISDSSTRAITDIPVVEDQPYSKFSSCILRIRSARLLTAKRDVEVISEADLRVKLIQDYGIIIPSTSLDDDDVGDVRYAVIGLEDNKLRWYKVPNADDTCRMHVYRMPYPSIEDESGCLEIADRHHIHLVKWMKHLAYSKEDAETYDKELAASNKAAFEEYCGVPGGLNAKQETERQRYKPRGIHYGGL